VGTFLQYIAILQIQKGKPALKKMRILALFNSTLLHKASLGIGVSKGLLLHCGGVKRNCFRLALKTKREGAKTFPLREILLE